MATLLATDGPFFSRRFEFVNDDLWILVGPGQQNQFENAAGPCTNLADKKREGHPSVHAFIPKDPGGRSTLGSGAPSKVCFPGAPEIQFNAFLDLGESH